jgi:putative thiamine transport system permease protein
LEIDALLQHPQFWGALGLTIFTGITSTAIALLCALMIVAGRMDRLPNTSAFLAVPHLSLAIGLAMVITPTGLIARILALPFGWTSPPQWISVQDPYGFSLIAALVLKETPFLVFTFASLLNRDDMRVDLQGQMRAARSLGHGEASVFARVVAPQILRASIWPLIAVFSYGMTVVDMALVIGPSQPPTLAQLVWSDLNDGEVAANARGTAGTLALCFMILMLLWVIGLLLRLGKPLTRVWLSGYPTPKKSRNAFLGRIWGFWRLFFLAAGSLLLIQSFAPRWPFPDLLPPALVTTTWQRLIESPHALITSLWLSLGAACVALILNMIWFETIRAEFDRYALAVAALVLCLPALVLGFAEYRLLLRLNLTGTAIGLFLVHLVPAIAYAFIMLMGPYRSFDPRWQASAAGLGTSPFMFRTRIKWPLLKAPLLSAFAVAVAVAIAQYVPAQLAAAGRFSTLPMEAVTLSSGGNRALIAAHGLLLAALPLLVFVLAHWFGRPRFRPQFKVG